MKKLLYLLSLLAGPALGQTKPVEQVPLYTGIYYKLSEPTVAYPLLSDSSANTVPATASRFPQNAQVLVLSYPAKGWAQIIKAGHSYYIPISRLRTYEKPLVGTQEAIVGPQPVTATASPSTTPSTGTNSSGGYNSGSQNIQVGPRGGHYYINSHGNKTYVKRR